MSVLKRIRENVGLVIALIALSLFSFIFIDLFKNFGNTADDTIAEIEGLEISYNDYQRMINMADWRASSAAKGEQVDKFDVYQEAWSYLIREKLFLKEIEESGFDVPAEEFVRVYTGNPSQTVLNSGFFMDSTNRYNPGMVFSTLQQLDQIDLNTEMDPQKRNIKYYFNLMEELVRVEQMIGKWRVAIEKAQLVSDNEINRSYNNEQRTANFAYVNIPYSTISDSSVTLTEEDYQEYYNTVKEKYRTKETLKLKYVYFPIAPSRKDSMSVLNDINILSKQFKESEKPFEFAATNSDIRTEVDSTLLPLEELDMEGLTLVKNQDSLIGPKLDLLKGGYSIFRMGKVYSDTNAAYKLRHVIVAFKGNTAQDTIDTKNRAEEILKEIQPDSVDFATIAMTKSDDPDARQNGGEIGWIQSRFMSAGFAKSVVGKKKGDKFIADLGGGFSVVEVLDVTDTLYSVAKITKLISSSTATHDSIYKRASSYQGLVIGGADMDQTLVDFPEAKANYNANLLPSSYTLSGLQGARPIISWAFETEEGPFSNDVLEAENAYVVARIEKKIPHGYLPLEDVKTQIERQVINRKKAKIIKEKLANISGADAQSIASAYGPGATVGNAMMVRFSDNNVTGLGNEPKVVGRAFGMQPNEVSKPLAGNVGVFVVVLQSINEPAAPISDQMKMFKKMQLTQSKRDQGFNATASGLEDIGDIRDYRYKFQGF